MTWSRCSRYRRAAFARSSARQRVRETDESGPHSPQHLNRARAELSDLVERERQIVLPGRGREHQPKSAGFVGDVAGVQFGCAEAAQEVLELVDRLDRRRRVVDRRRQRLDGDIDEKPDRIFRVLLEGPFAPETDGAEERVLRQRRSRTMDAQKNRALDQRVADRAGHHDRSARLPRQRDKRADVRAGDGAGLAEILHRLGRAAEPRAVSRRLRERAGRRTCRPCAGTSRPITARPWSPTRCSTLPI